MTISYYITGFVNRVSQNSVINQHVLYSKGCLGVKSTFSRHIQIHIVFYPHNIPLSIVSHMCWFNPHWKKTTTTNFLPALSALFQQGSVAPGQFRKSKNVSNRFHPNISVCLKMLLIEKMMINQWMGWGTDFQTNPNLVSWISRTIVKQNSYTNIHVYPCII